MFSLVFSLCRQVEPAISRYARLMTFGHSDCDSSQYIPQPLKVPPVVSTRSAIRSSRPSTSDTRPCRNDMSMNFGFRGGKWCETRIRAQSKTKKPPAETAGGHRLVNAVRNPDPESGRPRLPPRLRSPNTTASKPGSQNIEANTLPPHFLYPHAAERTRGANFSFSPTPCDVSFRVSPDPHTHTFLDRDVRHLQVMTDKGFAREVRKSFRTSIFLASDSSGRSMHGCRDRRPEAARFDSVVGCGFRSRRRQRVGDENRHDSVDKPERRQKTRDS